MRIRLKHLESSAIKRLRPRLLTVTERLKTRAPRTSQRHFSLRLTKAGILRVCAALMPSPCSPTGRRPSDQCHCRKLRYEKENVSTLRRHKLSSLQDFTVKVGNYILMCISQLYYDLLRALRRWVRRFPSISSNITCLMTPCIRST